MRRRARSKPTLDLFWELDDELDGKVSYSLESNLGNGHGTAICRPRRHRDRRSHPHHRGLNQSRSTSALFTASLLHSRSSESPCVGLSVSSATPLSSLLATGDVGRSWGLNK